MAAPTSPGGTSSPVTTTARSGCLPPPAGWLLLVDEGPGETWLYLPEEDHPSAVLDAFLGRRGRTDFARARRRSGIGSLASLGLLLGLFLIIYGSALDLGSPGQLAGVRFGLLVLRCDCPSGDYRARLPVPCKHAALAARRLEREGLARWDEDLGGWSPRRRPTPRARAV